MIGAIIGDIVGSPYEFHNIKRKDFPLFQTSSHFTDDTMMTLANAKWLTEDHTHSPAGLVRLMREIGRSDPYVGYGPTFIKWLYVPDDLARPYNSWGNGAGMRVSPVGLFAHSMEECLYLAKISAEVTHNHPEGIKGAQAIASSVFIVRESGDAFSEPLTRFVQDMVLTFPVRAVVRRLSGHTWKERTLKMPSGWQFPSAEILTPLPVWLEQSPELQDRFQKTSPARRMIFSPRTFR